MKKIILIITISNLFLFSCNSVRDSAGVNRKVIDEYAVINNPPLALPPDYNVLPSDEIISKKKIQKEDELTKEILLGLDENSNKKDESKESLKHEDAMMNSPETKDGHFVVPPSIE